MLFTQPLVGIAMFGLTGGIISAKWNNYDNYCSQTKRIENEKNHLLYLVKKGVNITPEVRNQRRNKIQSLSKKHKELESDFMQRKGKGTILNLGLIASTIASVANPGLICFLPVGISIMKIKHDKEQMKSQEKKDYAEGALHTVINEENIADVVAKRKASKKTTNKVELKKPSVKNTNTYNRSYYINNQNQNNPKI
jgi:Mor family transcriptional regulator